jgi:hypothetical protein
LLLQKYNKELKTRILKLHEDVSRLSNIKGRRDSLNAKKIDTLFSYKQRAMEELDKKNKEIEAKIDDILDEKNKINEFISTANGKYIIKKLENLGNNELEAKKKLLNISVGDMLLVEDVNIYNDKALKWLKERVQIILYRKKLSKTSKTDLKFEMIPAEKIKMQEIEHFAHVAIDEMNRKIEMKNIFHRIVKDYKDSRQK